MGGPSAAPSSRLIIGTAGHVDHGKTSLIRALTGVDTDRLPEEKARGISIELGFAPLTLPDGRLAAVVDVPGHERFLRTMVAGATGLDLVLLVVAADEGVMPQTREHLDICALLGLRRGLVALTKIDLVDPELRALATADVRDALAGTFLEGAPLVPCSPRAGTGLEEVRAALGRATADLPSRPAEGPARLPVDRVFTVKGFGTVVTGTVAGGRFQAGDEVLVLPGGASGRLRSLEVHGEARDEVLAGERAALNLPDLAEGRSLARGRTVVRPGEIEASTCVDVELTWLPVCPVPLGRRTQLLFHALTTQESASVALLGEETRVPPGTTATVRLHLGQPVALLPGDRFVLRGFRALPGHGTTVGGGRVLRVGIPPRRRRDRQALDLARRMARAPTDERIFLEVEASGPLGLPRPLLGARTGLGGATVDRALQSLAAAGRLARLGPEPGQVIGGQALADLAGQVLARLEELHRQAPLASGVAREALRTSTPGAARLDARVFADLIDRLAAQGALTIAGDLLRRAGFSPDAAESQRADLVARVATALAQAALAPPSPRELAAGAGVEVARVVEALGILVRRGEVLRVKVDLYFGREAIDRLREQLRAYLVERGEITAQAWKAMAGVTRKWAIPLAEHFDAEKLTLRVGEVRRLRKLPGAGR
jgi:selenocysteine-specific elongation factor